jgi:hypothetical protein
MRFAEGLLAVLDLGAQHVCRSPVTDPYAGSV